MTILDELAAYARLRVEKAKKLKTLNQIKEQAEALPKGQFSFEKVLHKPGMSFICECKKASPSQGVIRENFPYLQIAKAYEQAGADCLSVLTEPHWFLGENEHLAEIARTVKIPCLRKDFTVDSYMIYEAKILGAEAVLLICALSSREELKQYIKICDSLGLSALVEAHDEQEIKKALEVGARIIGVNNRNLKNFSVNVHNSVELRKFVPSQILFIGESGIKNSEDVKVLKAAGANGVLIGEALMVSTNIGKTLTALKGGNYDKN